MNERQHGAGARCAYQKAKSAIDPGNPAQENPPNCVGGDQSDGAPLKYLEVDAIIQFKAGKDFE